MAKKPTKEEMAATRFYKKRGVVKYKPPVPKAPPRKLALTNPNMKNPQQAKGPFMMAPGNGGSIKSAQNSPGPFRGDSAAVMFFKQPRMEHPMMEHPMKFEDQEGTGPGVTQEDVISARTKGYKPKRNGEKKPERGHSNPQLGGMMKPNDYHK